MSPFDYVNAISYNKKNLMLDPDGEKDYVAWYVNRALSQHHDTIGLANEMNRYWKIDNALQFSFLINTIRKKNRFGKWAKADKTDEKNLKVIQEVYGYSEEKARSALRLLSDDQLIELNKRVYKGGTRKP